MQRRAGPWLLGRGVARCPKGFSGRHPPPTGTRAGTPRLDAVSGLLPVHTLCYSVILWAPERGTLGLYTRVCAPAGAGGGGENVSFEFP